MPSESFAKLRRDSAFNELLPAGAIDAVRDYLRSRMFRDPHSDAIIDSVQLRSEPDNIQAIEINVSVTVYPSEEAVNHFYRSGFEGLMRAPTEIDIRHTVVVELDRC